MNNQILTIQDSLKNLGYYSGDNDGILGPITLRAIYNYCVKNKPSEFVSVITKIAQKYTIDQGLNITADGIWGPKTESAVKSILEPKKIKPSEWPRETTQELCDFFGSPGENLVRVSLPYPHRLSWDMDTKINSFKCNGYVKDSLEKILQKVLDHYGIDRIKELRLDVWGGCFNIRKIRGGDRMSTHSWGIAVDYDPKNNKLKWGKDKASFAKPEYDFWWKCWEDEGWVSLGRTKNFDWMHMQACRPL